MRVAAEREIETPVADGVQSVWRVHEDDARSVDAIQREIGAGSADREDAAWVGGMFWGELYPVDGKPAFHNYSYPILAIAD